MLTELSKQSLLINNLMRYFISLLFFFTVISVTAEVKLPALIRDSMILQRDTQVNIWGWASPKEKIKISFQNKKYNTTADNNGNWKIILSPMKAGGPYTMNINAVNHLTLKDILIGDVWICSGQSNMVHQMFLHRELYEDDIATANYPEIRHFWIPTVTDLQKPHDDLSTSYWKAANPKDVLQFSAVAYFFARKIYEKYHVPIGLINATSGGPGIESWISEAGLKEFPAVLNKIQKNKDTAYINTINRAAFVANSNHPKQHDKGLEAKAWYDTTYIPKEWRNIIIPGYWEDQGIKDLDGIVWYRKEIDVPASMTGIDAKIFMGRIVDADFFYVNGKLVGNTSYQYPQRRYQLPAGLLKPGKNIFVIRVINNAGKGGFVPDKPYYILAGNQKLDLKGEWQYKVGDVFLPNQNASPQPIALEYQPTALFNGMIAPLTNYTIKGFLWYQGEGNISNAADYEKLLPTMIDDWRGRWKQGDIPFLYVQLPNFGEVKYLPSQSPWAILREAELRTLSVPNTGMAVAIDLGEWNDIHPMNKKDVGIRLALVAENVAYADKNIVSSGPLYQSSKTEGNKIILSFTNIGSGLINKDDEELDQFAIAGADKKFVWAKAKIEGNNVIVWNDNIPNPVYVRYAWADNPDGANLYNKEGLPASPFRTDTPNP
jgi:sialate O-acetylesterase